MKYEIIFLAFVFMAIPLVSAVDMIEINASESSLIPGKTVQYNNYTFIITGMEKVYFNPNYRADVQTRIFIENMDRNGALEKKIADIKKSIEESRNYTSFLNGILNRSMDSEKKLSERMSSIAKEMGILKEENNSVAASLEKITEEKSALEKELEGKFLLTKGQSVLMLIVFSILILAVIVIETKAYFKKK